MFPKGPLKAFSLVEVMVASVIFSIAVVGIYASLANVKQQSMNISDKGMGAALCAQEFLESKRAMVDMRDWAAGGGLALRGSTAAPDCTQSVTLANGTVVATIYGLSYQIVDGGAGHSRKATVTVTW